MGVLNGLFILGRSVGLIAHHLDQKRLKTGLYRHPWDDISCKNTVHRCHVLVTYSLQTSCPTWAPSQLQDLTAVWRSR